MYVHVYVFVNSMLCFNLPYGLLYLEIKNNMYQCVYKFNKFIQNTVGHDTFTNGHTMNKHTYQDQYRIKYLRKLKTS